MRRLVLITEIIAPYRIPVFNALAKNPDIDLHVIFLAETDPAQRQWLIYKQEMQFSYQVLPSWRRRLGKHHFLLNRGLGAALKKARPDAIVCGGYNYLASWQALWWARRNRVSFLAWIESTSRDLREGHALTEWMKAKFIRSCEAFIVPGKSSAEYVASFAAPGGIFTAPNAVDTEFFAQRARTARQDSPAQRKAMHLPESYFLFVGRFIPQKGIFDLLKAYEMLPAGLRSGFGLVFVGSGGAKAELERQARRISEESVQVRSFAQREELATYYAMAAALVFPTQTDPWGLVVNEAMACALPIICSSAAGCASDLVEDGWNGRVTPPGAIESLSTAMQELTASPEKRREMGEHSWAQIQGYSPEACATGIAKAVLSCRAPGV